MDDLISRAALLKECAERQKTDPRFEERGWANHFLNAAGEPSTEWYCVEDMIENAPAVDAAPVVRCKDCMYFRPWRHDRGEDSRCEFWNAEIGAEDYCSQAIYLNNKMNIERRDGDA